MAKKKTVKKAKKAKSSAKRSKKNGSTPTKEKIVGLAESVVSHIDAAENPSLNVPIRSLSNVSFNTRKKIIETEQLDSTLLYLCAPASDCVTGTVIKLDDGQGSR